MIRLQDLTPQAYYNQSRDFQFIGRLFDIVLNYVKTSADNMYNLPCGKNMDEKLLNLLALTLGFQSKHHYNSKHLEAVCSVLPTILRHKGSLQAILDAVNAMLNSEGIRQTLDYYIEPREYITLYLPQQLSDLSLIRDLLPYILPAGMSCNLVKELKEVIPANTVITTEDTVIIKSSSGSSPIMPNNLLLRPLEVEAKTVTENNETKTVYKYKTTEKGEDVLSDEVLNLKAGETAGATLIDVKGLEPEAPASQPEPEPTADENNNEGD
jgi:hypothetical protein